MLHTPASEDRRLHRLGLQLDAPLVLGAVVAVDLERLLLRGRVDVGLVEEELQRLQHVLDAERRLPVAAGAVCLGHGASQDAARRV